MANGAVEKMGDAFAINALMIYERNRSTSEMCDNPVAVDGGGTPSLI